MDIVSMAYGRHKLSGNAEMTFYVAFVNQTERKGWIKPQGDGIYLLNTQTGPLYFRAESVVYIYPSSQP